MQHKRTSLTKSSHNLFCSRIFHRGIVDIIIIHMAAMGDTMYGPDMFVRVDADPNQAYMYDNIYLMDDGLEAEEENDPMSDYGAYDYALLQQQQQQQQSPLDANAMELTPARRARRGKTVSAKRTRAAKNGNGVLIMEEGVLTAPVSAARGRGSTRQRDKRRHTRYFLPRVTPNDWQHTCRAGSGAADVERTSSDQKRLERLKSVVLAEKELHYSLIQTPNNAFPQFVGMGFVRATISAAPFGQLQDVVAYLLKHNLVQKPENYDYFDLLKATGGGREILLNELLKEPDNVLMKAFLVMGRLRPAVVDNSRKNSVSAAKKNKKKKASDAGDDNDNNDDDDHDDANNDNESLAALASKDGPTQYQDLPFQMQDYPKKSNLNSTWYVAVPTDTYGMLQANIGGPYNDKKVYTEYPVRSIKGRYDGPPDKMVDLCGPEMNDWLKRTAHETKRDRELFIRYEDMREKIADRKRNVCTVAPRDLEYAANIVQQQQPLDQPVPWSQQDIDNLRRVGWTDEELKRIGYLPSEGAPQMTPSSLSSSSSSAPPAQ